MPRGGRERHAAAAATPPGREGRRRQDATARARPLRRPIPSFPRKRESKGLPFRRLPWTPPFAGVTVGYCDSRHSFSCGADVEMEAAHDAVPDQRRGDIAEAHAVDHRPGEIDARAAAADAPP